MTFLKDNNAYDISFFDMDSTARDISYNREPVRKKKGKVVRIPRKKIEQIRRRKHNPLRLAVGFALSAIVVAVVAAIIYGQVQLTELNQSIANAQEKLENSQSEYTQMQMKVDAKYTTAIVEEYAQDKLGMYKASNSQKEFVDLSSGDKAEVVSDADESIFDTIADAISSLWS
ncbi:MAG: hypothetical protein ACI4HZ_04765 [Ruminococcus sp.]